MNFRSECPPLQAKQLRAEKRGLANQLVVFRVRADPEPNDTVLSRYSYSSVLETNTGRPEAADFFEMQRRMLGVRLQQFEGFAGLFTDRSRKGVIAGPEIRRGVMYQIFVDFPAARA